MTAHTHGVIVFGVEGHVIDVEVHVSAGLVGTTIVGLPDTAVAESRDRARAAILNSGCSWPDAKITVGLSPASLHKRGPTLDVAIALAILAESGQVPSAAIADIVCVGELGLDGRVRPMTGTVVAALGAARAGMRTIVVPRANVQEAELIPGLTVVGISSLSQLIAYVRGEPWIEVADDAAVNPHKPAPVDSVAELLPTVQLQRDLCDVRGQAIARRGLEVAAAGGHHLAMIGAPGVGKTLLAERLPDLLPTLDSTAALEVTAIHSVAGRLGAVSGLLTRAPFEAPHHTASYAAMVGGGGGSPRAGLVSLAHRGVLFLDEAPEFNVRVLDALRQPLESGVITIARAGYSVRFPARFQLVLASNPCPCGHATSEAVACRCSPIVRSKYAQRLSGPLNDRMDVRLVLDRPSRAELMCDEPETTQVVAERVLAARQRMASRLANTPWTVNASVPGEYVRREWPLEAAATQALAAALDAGVLSARGADRAVKVAWTLADLAGRNAPVAADVYEAVSLRDGGGRWPA
ncbi:MAG: hypothetical protein RL745_114 [Actinomycetota bacterium]